ncbi:MULTISPECIES: hypothetical protein [Kitasatospora]|uniref:Uncharacterized protein n=1 Tax=Kitasatospora setae (strain ATCC 33774 / DSM 43861 / JCM 3304 / KCC A-0304 / NBRC 14216 / KM-6054) TaxID=452652 RepID=E4NG41_KITSK|nr:MULTISPECIES: hypothetical protein [Kitasatospora]BAJ30471.1 hypothetical protein KSE_46900 [Kitasatospora setae KM-6054]
MSGRKLWPEVPPPGLADEMAAALAAQGHAPGVATPTDSAPKWKRDILTVLAAADAAGVLRTCPHLPEKAQACAVLAEAPDILVCLLCYRELTPRRVCPDCKGPSGSASAEGGVEDVITGPTMIYSRMRCARCARSAPAPTAPGGTFGS